MTERTEGPWQLVEQLRAYAVVTAWCEWLELAGSLARGAGDAWSDVDAALGVHPQTPLPLAVGAALTAARRFAPLAAELTQPFGRGPAAHHQLQYADGRQLSLVVMPAAARSGLPNGAVALVDRSGRLERPWPPAVLHADAASRREWSILGWWEAGDALKHLRRGSLWRAVTSLQIARDHAWQLYADSLGVDYPLFGAVSVENAAAPVPDWMAASLPTAVTVPAVGVAIDALLDGLDTLTSDAADPDVVGIREVIRSFPSPGRLSRSWTQPSSSETPE